LSSVINAIEIDESIAESLGPEYGEALILDLDATWAESEPRTPLICILSIGSDPSPQITALAKQKEIRKYLVFYPSCLLSKLSSV
jgi:hypothetical protein